MKILGKYTDKRINSEIMLLEIKYGEYLSFAKDIIKNNPLQRKKVSNSISVYSLLKNDLLSGCIIPPLVLAVNGDGVFADISDINLLNVLREQSNNVIILDGLQRTYTLLTAEEEAIKNQQEDTFYDNVLHIQLYTHINKFGVLYRMLTLNSGQTPMTSRHQIEMLYHDLLDKDFEGIKLISDIEDTSKIKGLYFPFKNVLDGFNSYMTKNELPIDREKILDTIETLENISYENPDEDIFYELLKTYCNFFKTIISIYPNEISQDEIDELGIEGNPFGRTATKVFSTSQAFTGFGSAIGKMRKKGIIGSFSDINSLFTELAKKDNDGQWFGNLLKNMDKIKNTSKKIGNSQRLYMHYFFRELLSEKSDSYLDLNETVKSAYELYENRI